MDASALAQRMERLARAVERAASDTPSEARQTALEALARFGQELADYFAAADARSPARTQTRARLRGDLRALEERARTAGDWPETWRSVQREFSRFATALSEHERT